jgi:hypothetical protein
MEVKPGKADEKRLQAAEIKFMRKTPGFTLLDHKRNEEILRNLKIEPVSKFEECLLVGCGAV